MRAAALGTFNGDRREPDGGERAAAEVEGAPLSCEASRCASWRMAEEGRLMSEERSVVTMAGMEGLPSTLLITSGIVAKYVGGRGARARGVREREGREHERVP